MPFVSSEYISTLSTDSLDKYCNNTCFKEGINYTWISAQSLLNIINKPYSTTPSQENSFILRRSFYNNCKKNISVLEEFVKDINVKEKHIKTNVTSTTLSTFFQLVGNYLQKLFLYIFWDEQSGVREDGSQFTATKIFRIPWIYVLKVGFR